MKRLCLFLTALLLVLLCACGAQGNSDVYDVTYEGKTYTVDWINRTISFDDVVCSFELDSSTFRVTYPDGSSYWWTQSGDTGSSGWSDDYDENRYVSGDVLLSMMVQPTPQEKEHGKYWLLGLLFLGFGILNAVSPRTAWNLRYGWLYKDSEPSDTTLSSGRVIGVICIFVGIILFFV